MQTATDISMSGLLFAAVFILLAGIVSLRLHLKLEKDLFWGTVRTITQLFLMGYILRFIFVLDTWYLILLLYVVMIAFAASIAKGRIKEKTLNVFLPTFLSMLLSYMVVTWFMTAVIVQVQPWWEAKYFIPLGGMVIGNSISAVAISVERLLSDLRKRRAEVELHLSLGATASQASGDFFRGAVKAGMIPSITAMMGVGLVWLPGMMTGQIIAGSDPLLAVRYQIMIMLMLVGSATIATILVVYFVRQKCFAADHRLLV